MKCPCGKTHGPPDGQWRGARERGSTWPTISTGAMVPPPPFNEWVAAGPGVEVTLENGVIYPVTLENGVIYPGGTRLRPGMEMDEARRRVPRRGRS